MIALEGVSKSYRTHAGRRIVLDNVSLCIPPGNGLGVLGANGAGKSTLLRLLAGTEPPDMGRITRGGRSVSFPLGFSGTMHPKLSGQENVRFLARLYGLNARHVLSYVEDFAELGEYIRMPVETYSSGMLARLAFGACLAIRFDVYLIDEVTAVGDARFRAKCLEAFRARMTESDVVMASHDYETMRAYCDRAVVLANGRLTVFDDLEAAIDHHARAMRRVPEAA